MNDGKRWIEIKGKETKQLVTIVYNPYEKPTKEIIALFIPKKNLNLVYGVRTR